MVDDAKLVTFSQCAAEYIESHKAEWKGEKHVKLWKGSLKRYAEPIIGGLPVAAFDTALVLKVLKPIWQTKPRPAMTSQPFQSPGGGNCSGRALERQPPPAS